LRRVAAKVSEIKNHLLAVLRVQSRRQ